MFIFENKYFRSNSTYDKIPFCAELYWKYRILYLKIVEFDLKNV